MALFETLVVNLGAGILKGLSKLWLKDSPVLDSAAGSLIDTLKSKFDFKTAQSVEKLLRDVKDEICEKLEAFIDREFIGLAENDREAGIFAVGEVLAEGDIVPEIVRADLEASVVARAYSERAKSRFRQLGSDPENFAALLLREAVNFLVEAVRELPVFERAIQGEFLRRTSEILAAVRTGLDRAEEIRKAIDQTLAGSEKAAASFETQYRRSLAGLLDELELFGLRLVGGGITKYRLTMAYVTLKATTTAMPEPGIIDESFVGNQLTIVRGEAGSGKTTLMQWLAVRIARRELPGKLTLWNGLVPFYLRMRDYVDVELPAPESFLRTLMANLIDEMPKGWVNQSLRKGAVVLVDGVDELPQAKRKAFADWLFGLSRDFPKAVVIVSSRPAALDTDSQPRLGQLFEQKGFTRVDIEPMSLADSQALIEQWHAAVANDLAGKVDAVQIASLQVRLVNQIREKVALRTLASSPLLCAMICALNFDRRNATLPDDRMQLYRLALAMLLGDRDRDRQIPALLEQEEREELLDEFAYWLLRNSKSEAPKDDLRGQVEVAIRRLQRLRAMQPAEIVRDLLERSGVLRQPQHNVVGFIHRTFLEFMGARAAIAANDLDLLVDKAEEEDWRETIVFAAGHAQRAKRDEFVEKLLQKNSLHGSSLSIEVAAACCIETVGRNIAPDLLQGLTEQARRLFPPTDLARAPQLAAAAAMEPDLLLGHVGQGPLVIAACIRTAAIVASPRMLDVIASYADIDDGLIEAELLRAWDAFDDEEYIKQVLRRRERLAGIVLTDVTEEEFFALRLLAAFSQADRVTASLEAGLASYRKEGTLKLGPPASAFEEADKTGKNTSESPSLSVGPSFSLSRYLAKSLQKLKSLNHLSLSTVDPQVLNVLGDLPNLTSLSVNASRSVALDGLTRLCKLKELRLVGTGVVDVSKLAEITSLTKLVLQHTNVEDLTALTGIRLIELKILHPRRQPALVPTTASSVSSVVFHGVAHKTEWFESWIPNVETLEVAYPKSDATAVNFGHLSALRDVWLQGLRLDQLTSLAKSPGLRTILVSDLVHEEWDKLYIPSTCTELTLFGELRPNDIVDLARLTATNPQLTNLHVGRFMTVAGVATVLRRNPGLRHIGIEAVNIHNRVVAEVIARARGSYLDCKLLEAPTS